MNNQGARHATPRTGYDRLLAYLQEAATARSGDYLIRSHHIYGISAMLLPPAASEELVRTSESPIPVDVRREEKARLYGDAQIALRRGRLTLNMLVTQSVCRQAPTESLVELVHCIEVHGSYLNFQIIPEKVGPYAASTVGFELIGPVETAELSISIVDPDCASPHSVLFAEPDRKKRYDRLFTDAQALALSRTESLALITQLIAA